MVYLPSFADFDFSFILFAGWFQLLGSLISSAASAYGANKSAKQSRSNSREQRAWQETMSTSAHQREVKDLKAAGLNPILSARGTGAPTGAGSMAQTPDYSKAYGDAALKAAQLSLLSAQSRKTRAEALNTELQEPYNKALSDVYGSIAGVPAVGMKALGGVASGYGMYRGAKAVGRMLRKRKSKRASGQMSRKPNSKSKSKSKKSGPWHSDDMNRRYHESRKRIKRRPSTGYAPLHRVGHGYRGKIFNKF